MGIIESHLLTVKSDENNKAILSYSIRYQSMPSRLSDFQALAGDDFIITYYIRAMGIPMVYRVERGLFSPWNYRQKKSLSDGSPYSKIIKRSAMLSITQGK